MSDMQFLIENLNNADPSIRLDTLQKLMGKIRDGKLKEPVTGNDVNNHIHTSYSFSPYSPAKALWMAWNAGLKTAGIMDHDSISGAREFIRAGEIIGMATTIGIECRVDMSRTELNGRRINNPDQDSIAYMALHGVPHGAIDEVTEFFKPLIEKRNKRNALMVDKINSLPGASSLDIDFRKDVMPLSQYANGGSITERHIALALSRKIIALCGRGAPLVSFLKARLGLRLSDKAEKNLLDAESAFYEYDLLGLIKSDLISSFYINATDECPDVKDVIALASRIGAISAYAYLGDVGDSVTGDKKTQKFEDDYLDELFSVIKGLGFNALTYMPSRNTPAQISRIKGLCETREFFQISGEDINSPRQSFVCEAMKSPSFDNLKDSTWALIGHELAATKDAAAGMFSPAALKKYPSLTERICAFREIGLKKA